MGNDELFVVIAIKGNYTIYTSITKAHSLFFVYFFLFLEVFIVSLLIYNINNIITIYIIVIYIYPIISMRHLYIYCLSYCNLSFCNS